MKKISWYLAFIIGVIYLTDLIPTLIGTLGSDYPASNTSKVTAVGKILITCTIFWFVFSKRAWRKEPIHHTDKSYSETSLSNNVEKHKKPDAAYFIQMAHDFMDIIVLEGVQHELLLEGENSRSQLTKLAAFELGVMEFAYEKLCEHSKGLSLNDFISLYCVNKYGEEGKHGMSMSFMDIKGLDACVEQRSYGRLAIASMGTDQSLTTSYLQQALTSQCDYLLKDWSPSEESTKEKNNGKDLNPTKVYAKATNWEFGDDGYLAKTVQFSHKNEKFRITTAYKIAFDKTIASVMPSETPKSLLMSHHSWFILSPSISDEEEGFLRLKLTVSPSEKSIEETVKVQNIGSNRSYISFTESMACKRYLGLLKQNEDLSFELIGPEGIFYKAQIPKTDDFNQAMKVFNCD